MTTEELNTIVEAVVAELEKNGVDFDNEVKEAQDTDLVFVIRETDSGYGGFKVTWKGLLDIITAKAEQAKTDAIAAKNAAVQAKSDTSLLKTSVEQTVSDFIQIAAEKKAEIENVYQSDLSAEATARTEADNALGVRIDEETSARAEADTALGSRIDTETTNRESEVAELERVNAIQKYEIENLKAKAEGEIYRNEVVDTEAYSMYVPSSVAPYAELQKIGGKSVVWNQLFNLVSFNKSSDDVTLTITNNRVKITGTALIDNYYWINPNFNVISGHKYICLVNIIKGDASSFLVEGYAINKVFEAKTTTINIGYSYKTGVTYNSEYVVSFIDLTKMFGAGNEPTLEECQKIFSADYYPYDAGTLKSFPVQRVKSLKADGTEIGNIDVSSFTTDFKSVGLIHDEWQNGKVTNRIGVVDLGTFSWIYNSSINIFYSYFDKGKNPNQNYLKADILCNKYEPSFYYNSGVYLSDKRIAYNKNNVFVKDTSYTDATTFKQAMSGVMLYYELATPTEEAIPEIDNYLEVEGGGFLTFESDETVKMPVPSTTRFVVDLTKTTEATE